jgi:hypothetical protein
MNVLCRHCGLSEEKHHRFQPEVEWPKGCVCPPGEWDLAFLGEVPPICERYVGNGFVSCETCEHYVGCHVPKT